MASNKGINIIHMGVYKTMLTAEGAAIALDDVQYKPIAKVTY